MLTLTTLSINPAEGTRLNLSGDTFIGHKASFASDSESIDKLSSGPQSSCVILVSGNIKCWGNNGAGQLGDGTTSERLTPVNVVGIANATQVAIGSGHACALISSGGVKCWGENYHGQLGDGTTSNQLAPTEVTGITNVKQIASNNGHTCAILASGQVACWGSNSHGQLGDGTTNDRSNPGSVIGIENAIQLDLGAFHSCALISSGVVKCWGGNSWGQLGDGTTSESLTPVNVVGITNATQVALGSGHACALISSGVVKCWGGNSWGQLGDGTTSESLTPVNVVGITNATQVALGSGHACALISSGVVKCWGENNYGQIGDGTRTDQSTPTSVLGVTNPSRIAIGGRSSCAQLTTDSVKCWGLNTSGQLGDGTKIEFRRTPAYVEFGFSGDTIQFDSGYNETCAVLSGGGIKCWGRNDMYGNLGDGTKTNRSAPVEVAGITNATQVATSISHSCAVLEDNNVKCWGGNFAGQLGDGTTTERLTLVDVVGITDALQVATNYGYTCALLNSGTVNCWGDNFYGQLGDGTTLDKTMPVEVSGISNALQIATSQFHACAVLENGRVKCWGYNHNGQLGDGSSMGSLVSVEVDGITDAKQVATSFYHSCAVLYSGGVKCWGNNEYGKLGDGTTSNSLIPVDVVGLSNAIHVSTGTHDSCAVLSSGGVKCWGENSFGQLGDGTTTGRLTPVDVVGITNATEIASGNGYACAKLDTGGIHCWGSNYIGQFGDGTTSDSFSPKGTIRLFNTELAEVGDWFGPGITDSSVQLAWGEDAFDGYGAILGYVIRYRELGTITWLMLDDAMTTLREGIVSDLASGVEYEFQVGIVNSAGTRFSDSTFATTWRSPDAPVIVVDKVRSNVVIIKIIGGSNGGTPITNYIMEQRHFGDSTWLPAPGGGRLPGPSLYTRLYFPLLTPGTQYEFRIAVTNVVGTSPYSNIVTATPGFVVSSFTPLSVLRGTAIDVSGQNLSLVSEVQIGSIVVPFRFVSNELIVVTVPTNARSGNLRLLSDLQDVIAGALTVSTSTVAPTITAVEPYVSVPGAVVTVRGNNVGAASTVRIGSVSVPFSVTGRGSFTITLGANLVNGKVQVTTPGGSVTSSGTLVVPPRITTSLLRAGVGVLVSLTGENLVDVTSVSVGGKNVTPSSKTATSVSFTIPSGVVNGSGTVTGPGGGSNSFTFELLNPPTLNSFTISAKIGDTITLTGTNLMNVTGVKVGTTAASSFSSNDTTVTFVVPTGATSNKVTFSGVAGTVTSASTLTVAQPPKITRLSPTRGKVGATVTITGTNLSNATVTFGTKLATKSTNTANQIKVKVPTGLAKGVVTIKIVTANGEATISFTVT